jgi:hypothetical protein
MRVSKRGGLAVAVLSFTATTVVAAGGSSGARADRATGGT